MDPLHDADNQRRQHRHGLANVLDCIVRVGAVGIGTAQAMNISSSSGLPLPMVMMGGYVVAGAVVEGLQTFEPFVRNKLLRLKRRRENEEPILLHGAEEEGEERPARRARLSPSEAAEEQASLMNSDTENEQDEEHSSVEEPHQEPSRSPRSDQSRSHASFSVFSLSSSSEDEEEEDDKNKGESKETQLETQQDVDVAATTQEDERSDLDTVVSNDSNDDDRSESPELLAPIPPTPTKAPPVVNRFSSFGATDASPMNPFFVATPSSTSRIRIGHPGDYNADLNKLRFEVKTMRLEGDRFVRHMNAETCTGVECPFNLTSSECHSVRDHINHLCHCDGRGGTRCPECVDADRYLWTHVRHCRKSDCQVTLCKARNIHFYSSQSQ